ncbi:MAG TPA: universal stress protein [Haliangiales bacterium]|nr:universal stress protein [Haliangiales bacterium]
MYKKILVATDLTPASEPAVRAALELAKILGAHVTALHVLDAPLESTKWFLPDSPEMQSLRAAIAREENTIHAELAAQIGALAHGAANIHAIVRRGNPVDVIRDVAEEIGADLLVLGTHGRRGIQHALLGSVAERVVRTATQAVLTIRSR